LDELVARINSGGGKEARGGLQAADIGVFPSFIVAIFIDDVLWSLHYPGHDDEPAASRHEPLWIRPLRPSREQLLHSR
jgi:hypothetical protein